MNWKQTYTSATPQEREEITRLMLERLAERDNPYSWVNARQKLRETLNTWPFIERRQAYAYVINGRRWYELEPVQPQNTRRFQIIALASAGLVTTISLILASNNLAYLLIIPAFALYAVFIAILRQVKLQAQAA